MTMTELREAFANGWATGTSHEIIQALRGPTPITESGLRELGADVAEKFAGEWSVYIRLGGIKTIGQLRGLLLSVGE